MNNRKNQNSILVLATLGVYLGLVLVGATPPVLAQAAMTKQFNVKDEVEVKDEFDNNPDIEQLKSLITNALEGTVASFIRDIRRSDRNSVSGPSLSESHSLRSLRNFCGEAWVEVTDPLKSLPRGDDPFNELHRALDLGSQWEFATVPRFIQAEEGPPKQKFCKAFSVSTTLGSDGLSVKLLISRAGSINAFRLAGYLNDFLFDRSHNFQDPITRQLYEHTRATSDYANLVVVTNLPRADLDSLLATKAK